jgi:hypothetical protein
MQRESWGNVLIEANDRADHWKELLAIVDSFDPSPEVRAYALRAMDVEQAKAWRDRVEKDLPWREQIARVRAAFEGLGAPAWVKIRQHGCANGLTMPGRLSEFVALLIPETPPPSAPRQGHPPAMLARDLARGVARAWMELTGEYPPKVRAGCRTGGQADRFYDLMTLAFAAAGLKGAETHAFEAAQRVRDEKDEHRRLGNPEFIEWRDEVLRAMGELREYRLPRRGRPKSIQKRR